MSQRIEFNSLDEMREKLSGIQLEKGEYAHIHVEMYVKILPQPYLIVPWMPFPKCYSENEIVSFIDSKFNDSLNILKAHGLILHSKKISAKYVKFDGVYCHYTASMDILVEGDIGHLEGVIIVLTLIIGAILAIGWMLIQAKGFVETGRDILKPLIYIGGVAVILLLIFLILREVRR